LRLRVPPEVVLSVPKTPSGVLVLRNCVRRSSGCVEGQNATSLNNLAALYHSMSDYAKAEPLFLQALRIDEKALGPEHQGFRRPTPTCGHRRASPGR